MIAMVIAAAAGGVAGYWYGVAFLLGRYLRSGGRASPDERIPYLLGIILGLACAFYAGKWVGVF